MANTITKIEAQKRKGRFNVYVDGQYAFPISEEVLIKYRDHFLWLTKQGYTQGPIDELHNDSKEGEYV